MQEGVPFSDTLEKFRREPAGLIGCVPGIWPVNKPSGPSSNLVVVRARKAIGTKRVGHAGTLDPLAAGLLVLLAGNATRLFDELQEYPKTYEAGFRLGERTDSQDITGTALSDWTPSRETPCGREEIESVLPRFTGDIMQVPPMHSALKRDGRPLYKLARQGVRVERPARPVTVYRLELLEFDGVVGRMAMDVSKGTYVRTVLDDIGVALGTGAVMTSLTRTAIGPFRLADAAAMDDIASLRRKDDPGAC
jgi:tRNA pseudouridine 55 synthase